MDVRLLDRVLSKEAYQVKTAIDGDEALEFLDENDISFALIDIRMHPICGVDLLVEIKKRSPATQVIIITSFLTPETKSRCIQYGATNYLTKPLEMFAC